MKKATNRLAAERSPYLLQHSQNPVDWYPWGEAAFSRAKIEDRLIFLSIGYSSCHWCHVMERESFENEEIAEVLNEHFISVKVDREELPEIDNLYMEFAQSLMGGQAGWPLNLFLTPDLHPIFATTYLPPKGEGGLVGFLTLLENILEVWNSEEREKILDQAEKMVEALRDKEATYGEKISEKELISKGIDQLFQLADPVYGGLMGAPKFPITPQLFLLAHHVKRTEDSRALFMIEKSLQGMYMGGIFDHLGGGFHRYSVDGEWFQPHFEKMVSENSLLTEAYLLGYLLTNNLLYKKVAVAIQKYLIDEMCSEEGPFFTAQDADSEGFEGRYYLWSREEIDRHLRSESSIFCDVYSVIPEGNFEEGRNILFLLEPMEKIAEEKKMEISLLNRRMDSSKMILLAARNLRSAPFRDTKILLGTNALQIAALVRLGQITSDASYFQKAKRVAVYIRKNLFDGKRLLRQQSFEERHFFATLEEYAFLVRALLLMAEADLGVEWLEWAIVLSDLIEHKFKVEGGAFLSTDAEEDYILLRKPLFLDGQEPSGNAITCANFMKLARLTGEESYLLMAKDILKAVKPLLENYPSAYGFHLANLEEFYDTELKTLFLHVDEEDKEKNNYLEILGLKAPFLGGLFVIRKESESLPYFQRFRKVNGYTTLYICSPKGCLPPVVGQEAIINAIQNL